MLLFFIKYAFRIYWYFYWLFTVDLFPLQIKIGWDNRFYVHVLKHSDHINLKLLYYQDLSEKVSRKELIKLVLGDHDQIKKIIFCAHALEGCFVQFFKRKKSIYLDFPATNIHDDSFEIQTRVEKILIEKGYEYIPQRNEPYENQYYFESISGGKILVAYFGEDSELAADIAEEIFTEIYHSKDQVELHLV